MLLANIQPIIISYTPDNDITGFIISIILILFIASIPVIATIEIVYNRAKAKLKITIQRIKRQKAQKHFNNFYKSIIDNKILLSANELQTIKNNYLNI